MVVPGGDRREVVSKRSACVIQEADSTTWEGDISPSYLSKTYKTCWTGIISAKNLDMAASCDLCYLSGEKIFVNDVLPTSLRVLEFMNVHSCDCDAEQEEMLKDELAWIEKKMKIASQYCVLATYDFQYEVNDDPEQEILTRFDFLQYISRRRSSGICNIYSRRTREPYTAYVFPECEFANEIFAKEAPEFLAHNFQFTKILILVIKN